MKLGVLAGLGMSFVAGAFWPLSPVLSAEAADSYPSRAVRVVVPFPPGGALDIIARETAARLTELLGQNFFIENRAGASGAMGVEAAARAAPDGYTLLAGNVSTNSINETLFADSQSTRPSRDLVAITKLVEIPHILAATPSLPARTVAEFITLARNHPGKFNYGSIGAGSYNQLDTLRLEKVAGIKTTHVPSKGAAPIIQGLMTGEIHISFANLASALNLVKAGKLKALATITATRLAELPQLATMAEQGFAGIGTNAWQGLFAPAATPRPFVDKLFKTAVAALSPPEVKEKLAKRMMDVTLSRSPQDFAEFVRADTQKWAEVIRENNVRIE
ncbi:MAG: tripartite tricarboxylate transporter substrate binding protein [Burkholderiales bacterium]|nr:tripartite tricarboxylate transporter substrate binding protein [Burkholderiales bacterium]